MTHNTLKRAPSDDLDGDILTFSELDFARLGLVNKEPNDNFSSELDQIAQEYPFPIQNDIFTSDQSFFTNDFDLDLSTNPQNEFWIDPALNLQSWQIPPSMQTDSSRDISPLLTADELVGTPSLASPSFTSGLNQGFAGLPPLENHRHSLPRRRSQYFRTQLRGTATEPIAIPHTSLQRDNTRDPMQRWQDSPPEAEPASLSAIADALKKTPLRTRSSVGSLASRRIGSRAGSIASLGSATSCSSVSVGSPHSATRRQGRVAKTKRAAGTKGKKDEQRRFPYVGYAVSGWRPGKNAWNI
ncbi:hypothetical protein ACLX1H_000466 [Fusarium chlamydosporum]